jgi:hypothetical protein
LVTCVLRLHVNISEELMPKKSYTTINLCYNQCIRIERVNMKEIRSIAKVIGTLVTFAGALMMILYKGPQIHLFYSPKTAHNSGSHDTQTLKHWVSGTLFLMMGCVAWSSFFILQATIIPLFFMKVFFFFVQFSYVS